MLYSRTSDMHVTVSDWCLPRSAPLGIFMRELLQRAGVPEHVEFLVIDIMDPMPTNIWALHEGDEAWPAARHVDIRKFWAALTEVTLMSG
jgi:hypothetical protein